jgi:hypothetical protein
MLRYKYKGQNASFQAMCNEIGILLNICGTFCALLPIEPERQLKTDEKADNARRLS